MDTATPIAEPAATRQVMTILFADLSGSTGLSAQLEAEDYAAILARVSHAFWTVIARHGGQVVSIQGDGVLAVFGYPTPSENDGRHATEAALELHATVRVLHHELESVIRQPLSLHSGIHAGVVLVREGNLFRGRLELTGAAPNIAARLSDAAQADEILVSSGTLGPDVGLFAAGPLRRLDLTGAATPMLALPILAKAPVDNRFEARAKRGLSPFVGRSSLLESIGSRLCVQQGNGGAHAVALVGSPGMGKTRMANQFLASAREAGAHVLQGYCEDHLGAEPLQPFLQMLRHLIRAEHQPSPELGVVHLSAGPRDWQASQPFLQFTMPLVLHRTAVADVSAAGSVRQGFVDCFCALAQVAPLVLFIDDWQWADDSSHQILDALLRQPLPVLLLLAGRPGVELTLPQAVDVLTVGPLNDEASEATVRNWLPRAQPFLVNEICRYAGGNPLYLEELCHRAVKDAQIDPVVRVHGGEAWLNSLIASRVARLPQTQVQLLQSAAVIGHTAPSWLFERLTGYAPDHPLVRALADEDLLFPGEQPDTLRFKHALTRDVVYEGVGLRERTRLHLAAAQALAGRHANLHRTATEACEALAYHFSAAGEPEQAAIYAEVAGDRAVLVSALDRAKTQYRAALTAYNRLGPTPGVAKRWSSIAQRLGLVSVFDPSPDEIPVFERAVELALLGGNPLAQAKARYWLGYIHYALGDSAAALQQLEEASRLATSGADAPLQVQIDATLGQALASAGRYREAMALLDPAIAVKRRHRSGAGHAVGLTYSLVCKGYALGDIGQFEAAQACFQEALHDTACEQPEVVGSVLGWFGAVRLWQGRHEEALQLASQAQREGERVRSLHLLSMGRSVASYARWCLTGQPQALNDLQEATDWLERRRNALFSSLSHGWLAEGLAALGNAPAARRHAAQALRRARRSDMLGACTACRTMARQSLSCGDTGRAQQWLAQSQHWAAVRESLREKAENLWCEVELARAERWPTTETLVESAQQATTALGMRPRHVRSV